VARALVLLIVIFGAGVLAVPAAAKPSKFADRLRAAAEPDEEVGTVEPEEGLPDEPEEEPAEPDAGGGDEGEDDGGHLAPPRALPEPEEAPPAEPAAAKPIPRGPAQPERAEPPAGPVE
jgi:hypothetical protein